MIRVHHFAGLLWFAAMAARAVVLLAVCARSKQAITKEEDRKKKHRNKREGLTDETPGS